MFEGKGAGDQVRACVMGCATGEEAYSIAILLLEHASTLDNAPKIQIFATDIDERSLATARKGRYPSTASPSTSRRNVWRDFSRSRTAPGRSAGNCVISSSSQATVSSRTRRFRAST